MIGNLSDAIYTQPDLRHMMEPIMIHHVLDDLSSSIPYLKWRSLWFYSQFERFYPLQDSAHLHQVVDSAFKSLFDSSLVIRVQAAVTLNKVLDKSDDGKRFLRPALKDLIN